MLISNKECKTCIHDCVCEQKVFKNVFEKELGFFCEGFDDDLEVFDLNIDCKHYQPLKSTPKGVLGIDFATSTSRNAI